jgi:polysaccharide export outer membrane protein
MPDEMLRHRIARVLCSLLALTIGVGPQGCAYNPAESMLPPSAVAPPGAPFPMLSKGEVYADDSGIAPDLPISVGDVLEVFIRRGAGEEKFTSTVRDSGEATVAFLDIKVVGLTPAQAEARIQEEVSKVMRDPRVQLQFTKKQAKVKRIFVFGEVTRPGQIPMTRGMTVMQAIAAADNYKESALLDEIRVIRGNLNQPEILTADLSRLFTYGDFTRNLALEENDVIYVPRDKLGDRSATANRVIPIMGIFLQPLFAATLITTLGPGIAPAALLPGLQAPK